MSMKMGIYPSRSPAHNSTTYPKRARSSDSSKKPSEKRRARRRCGRRTRSSESSKVLFVIPRDNSQAPPRRPPLRVGVFCVGSEVGKAGCAPDNRERAWTILRDWDSLAEREGFEPSVPVTQYARLAIWCLRPLGHLSAG